MLSNVSLNVLIAGNHPAGFLPYISSCFNTESGLKNKRKGLQVCRIHNTVSIAVPFKSCFMLLLAVQIQAKYMPLKQVNGKRSYQQYENKLLKNHTVRETQAGC